MDWSVHCAVKNSKKNNIADDECLYITKREKSTTPNVRHHRAASFFSASSLNRYCYKKRAMKEPRSKISRHLCIIAKMMRLENMRTIESTQKSRINSCHCVNDIFTKCGKTKRFFMLNIWYLRYRQTTLLTSLWLWANTHTLGNES